MPSATSINLLSEDIAVVILRTKGVKVKVKVAMGDYFADTGRAADLAGRPDPQDFRKPPLARARRAAKPHTWLCASRGSNIGVTVKFLYLLGWSASRFGKVA